MPKIPGLPGDVYFGAPGKPLPDWRRMLPAPQHGKNTDDDAISPSERQAITGMLGFDPAEIDDDHGPRRETRKRYSLRLVGGRIRIRILYAKSTPLRKTEGGKLVSARNKSGSAQCSRAASELSTGNHSPDTFTTLAKCRAMARGAAAAHRQRAAGHEAKAQHIEHLIRSSKPLGAKERAARAKALQDQRAAKRKPAEPTAPPTKQPKSRDTGARRKRITDKVLAAQKQAAESPADAKAKRLAERYRGRETQARHAESGKGLFAKLRDRRLAKEAAGQQSQLPVQAATQAASQPLSTEDARRQLGQAQKDYRKARDAAKRHLANGNTEAARPHVEAAQRHADRMEALAPHTVPGKWVTPNVPSGGKPLPAPTRPAPRPAIGPRAEQARAAVAELAQNRAARADRHTQQAGLKAAIRDVANRSAPPPRDPLDAARERFNNRQRMTEAMKGARKIPLRRQSPEQRRVGDAIGEAIRAREAAERGQAHAPDFESKSQLFRQADQRYRDAQQAMKATRRAEAEREVNGPSPDAQVGKAITREHPLGMPPMKIDPVKVRVPGWVDFEIDRAQGKIARAKNDLYAINKTMTERWGNLPTPPPPDVVARHQALTGERQRQIAEWTKYQRDLAAHARQAPAPARPNVPIARRA